MGVLMIQRSLEELRREKNLSKKELAYKLGMDVDCLERLEKDSSHVSQEKLERILALFNITYDEIVLGKNN